MSESPFSLQLVSLVEVLKVLIIVTCPSEQTDKDQTNVFYTESLILAQNERWRRG